MDELDHQRIEEALTRLGETLDMDLESPLEVVVCGGAALNIAGYVHRTTTDVDILGLLDQGENQVDVPELPDEFKQARDEIQQEMGLRKNWINTGPSLLVPAVPDGLTDRLQERRYSDTFIVHTLGRKDQIYLKMYASIDEFEPHLGDLEELEPDDREIIEAIEWAVTNYPADWPRGPVVEVVEDILDVLEAIHLLEDVKKTIRESGEEDSNNPPEPEMDSI
jgi:hypothetical protein